MMRGARILLVEDDAAIVTVIRVALDGENMWLDAVDSIAARDAALAANRYDCIITDVMLPDGNGLTGLSALGDASGALPPVIVLSAQNTLDTAVRASEQGAFDYLPKPFDLDELVEALRAAVYLSGAGEPVDTADDDFAKLPIIGRAAVMQTVYRTLARVAPTDLSVLILGESGTGKELVAQAIHNSSRRRARPFVAVNMAAIPRDLIESELFGHEKGAFTGAVARTSGRFEQAEGGSLFLDEIGDMPIEAQTRLLRVLQSGDYSPVGSSRVLRADVRIIAATNQNLLALVGAGRFREDLYYRLNVIPIELPPLRDRRSDIALLADHFLGQGSDVGLARKSLSADAVAALSRYGWPGNVRELGNIMQRLALLTRGQVIGGDDVVRLLGDALDAAVGGDADPAALLTGAVRKWLESGPAAVAAEQGALHATLVGIVESTAIESILEQTGGNQVRAAALLGINRNTLRLKRRTDDSDIA
jgi:two-component system, NtrC family, nitrogen regulation response regulator GlnG